GRQSEWSASTETGGQLAPKWLVRLDRNGWSDSSETGGQIRPKYALKHMLGLAQTRSEWKLLLLWFAPTSEALRAMDAEASRFRQIIGSDGARFTWQTYQELWSRLAPRLSPRDDEYARYLEQRSSRPSVV